MAQVELIMPKMGESIIEATILNWVKQVGDTVEVDETVLEIATDKVDSEVPAPVAGTIKEIRFEPDTTVAVGEVIALIETEAGAEVEASPSVAPPEDAAPEPEPTAAAPAATPSPAPAAAPAQEPAEATEKQENGRFYSPLVRTIAEKEGIGQAELDQIPGTGNGGRVNKQDIQAYLKRRDNRFITGPGKAAPTAGTSATTLPPRPPVAPAGSLASGSSDEIIEMDRMRKLIADHMVDSKRTSPHVTSFIEVDVTDIVNWRERVKKNFQQQHGEKITYTPIFIEAVAKAIKDFPLVNVSVDGTKIIKKANINIGMAAALPSGNLIVPVIRNADQLNLMGLTKRVNDLASRARQNKLKPEEIKDGTFTVTNVGTFGNVMGTPIINQPQVAILAVGAIRKKPAVVETEYGDLIAVRQMMYMSLSYDHRVVDGFLGGSFLRRIGDYLEAFDPQRSDV
ncbi:2-oxoglutarate dehydrogenase E2 component (dihydrolipoamide succinyltransferase) [Lewinella marina]|uniref:Dihydrolipoamide acetyltransferase component of pyruvate dehydrogenase complex n=1 Tax=Neolewinella marina TaxID=438751 RepID=A0A2G0CB42_9BACT|nr:dihydrolipoamide acetyltransferase family protein [Neolewinella marina]NJB86815.1 2-oxoglutarate dehydrogenase E2 component (dihydrolipoamide succinyltransferase) [Neolewinella marina]PHK97175.1 diapophytoene dehydrogenase [Neolewinella marina]